MPDLLDMLEGIEEKEGSTPEHTPEVEEAVKEIIPPKKTDPISPKKSIKIEEKAHIVLERPKVKNVIYNPTIIKMMSGYEDFFGVSMPRVKGTTKVNIAKKTVKNLEILIKHLQGAEK